MKKLAGLVVFLLSLVAVSGAAGACFLFGHQPKLPEALRR